MMSWFVARLFPKELCCSCWGLDKHKDLRRSVCPVSWDFWKSYMYDQLISLYLLSLQFWFSQFLETIHTELHCYWYWRPAHGRAGAGMGQKDRQLFVANLGPSSDINALRALFEHHGPVQNCFIQPGASVRNNATKVSILHLRFFGWYFGGHAYGSARMLDEWHSKMKKMPI